MVRGDHGNGWYDWYRGIDCNCGGTASAWISTETL